MVKSYPENVKGTDMLLASDCSGYNPYKRKLVNALGSLHPDCGPVPRKKAFHCLPCPQHIKHSLWHALIPTTDIDHQPFTGMSVLYGPHNPAICSPAFNRSELIARHRSQVAVM